MSPVYLIGLDAFDAVLMKEWSGRGLLPNLSRLMHQGAQGRLHGSTSLMQGSVWPTIASGRDPGEHGMYYMLQPRERSHKLRLIRAGDVRCIPFWARLGALGKRSLIIDVPKQGLRAQRGTTQIVEWGAMDHYSRFATAPWALKRTVLADFGRHALLDDLREPRTSVDYSALLRGLLDGIAAKTALTSRLIDAQAPELCFCVYGEAHPAGHYFWRFTGDAGTAGRHDDLGDALQRVYIALDTAVGELVERYGRTANLVVFSGHGMTADHHPRWLMDQVLLRMGLTAIRSGQAPWGAQPGQSGGPFHRSIVAFLGTRLRDLANRHVLPRFVQRRFWLRNLQRGIDHRRSEAWALPSDLQGFVRINLVGREPTGRVLPENYDALVDRLCSVLSSLHDATTGLPVVERIYKTRDHYAGQPWLDLLPDLCVLWRNSAVDRVTSPTLGEFLPPEAPDARSGNHRMDGFFCAVGPDVAPGVDLGDADLVDLAPSVLELLGAPIPTGLRGRPLPLRAKGSG